MEEERESRKILPLIEKATNSTASEIDPRILKAIKTVVRYSDSELRIAAQTLMDLMKRPHSQVRYLTLLIIDELFMRSKLFRTLITENLDQLLSLSVGFRRNHPLPAPASVATVLRSKAIEFLEKWNATFGIHYRQLRLGYDYLKNTLRFQFPNLQANAARIQRERREREMKTREILRSKFETLRQNFSSIKEEIQSTIDEIGECLEILRAKDETLPVLEHLDDEDSEEIRNPELQQIRLNALKEAEKVLENSENKVVFDALRELFKLLVMKHLVTVQQWISVLIRVEVDDTRFRDSVLKEFIDIRNHIQAVKKKCEESGCVLPDRMGDEDDDIWEEGTIESINNPGPTFRNKHTEDIATSSTANGMSKKDTSESSYATPNSKRVGKKDHDDHLTSLRSKLLAEAPVINWGSALDNWGEKRDVFANQRGLELESHWGRVDHDAVIPAEKVAQLNVHATTYEEERPEIQPCRAPLSKGGLCRRRDLRVCPFHGPIIPRDDEGNPINVQDDEKKPAKSQFDDRKTIEQTPLTEEMNLEGMNLEEGTSLVEQLAKRAMKNVRERDKEVMKKKETDRQAMKRAKLAKIREHNEAVIREAALASTSSSATFGEYEDAVSGERASAKNKKPTLASMLRRKIKAKDRLAQRLLNTRARDATVRQLTQGEDMNYREAFPNQW